MKILIITYFCVCIYSTTLPLARCDTRSIFKWSKAGLNLEFFFLLSLIA